MADDCLAARCFDVSACLTLDCRGADGKRGARATGAEVGKAENLADLEMEEEKRHLINREIDKFRDTYKVSRQSVALGAIAIAATCLHSQSS